MATRSCSFAFSTNARDDRIVVTFAALQAAATFTGPAVKLIIAGTRPIVCRAKNVTATPAEFGSITPIASPGAAYLASLPPSTCAPVMSLPNFSLVPSGSSMITLPVSRVAFASTSASNKVRRILAVSTAVSTMMSCSRAPAAWRRALPFNAGSMSSLRAGRIVTVTFGNHDLRVCERFR